MASDNGNGTVMEQELVYHDSEERKRILDNTYINAMVFHNEMCREWMREIQGVYIVTKTNEPPNQSVNKEIHLMWDHDRLWGLFCFRAFKGVFLVDPGPGQEIFKDVDELFAPQYLVPTDKGLQEPQKQREYRLVWRGEKQIHGAHSFQFSLDNRRNVLLAQTD